MSIRSREHLSDSDLVRSATRRVRSEFLLTAEHLADLAAIDARQDYRAEAFSSLLDCCTRGLGLTEDEARFRIRIARVGGKFPALFEAIADGRLRPSAVDVIAVRLTPESVDDLIAVAAHRTIAELRELLAARFPKPDVPDQIVPLLATTGSNVQEMSGEGGLNPPPEFGSGATAANDQPLATFALASPASAESAGPPASFGPRTKLEPLSADSFALHGTIRRRTHERIEYVKSLLGHAVRGNDLDELLFGAFDAWARELERKKYGITDRPRTRSSRPSTNPRYIPNEVKRAVAKRDAGQCTFVSESGRRCEAREDLEFDREIPVARGGAATVGNLRLRCRAHNQFEAEQTYGAEFMRHKRIAAREASEQRKREKEARARDAAERAQAEAKAKAKAVAVDELIPWLRALRIGKEQARRAAEIACEQLPGGPLEERARLALKSTARAHPISPPASARAPLALPHPIAAGPVEGARILG